MPKFHRHVCNANPMSQQRGTRRSFQPKGQKRGRTASDVEQEEELVPSTSTPTHERFARHFGAANDARALLAAFLVDDGRDGDEDGTAVGETRMPEHGPSSDETTMGVDDGNVANEEEEETSEEGRSSGSSGHGSADDGDADDDDDDDNDATASTMGKDTIVDPYRLRFYGHAEQPPVTDPAVAPAASPASTAPSPVALNQAWRFGSPKRDPTAGGTKRGRRTKDAHMGTKKPRWAATSGHPEPEPVSSWQPTAVRGRLMTQWMQLHRKKNRSAPGRRLRSTKMTTWQASMFPLLNEYADVLHSDIPHSMEQEVRELYVLHALNHVMKATDIVKRHRDSDPPDQGFTRPKVVIMLPYRNAAYDVIRLLLRLIPRGSEVANRKRFEAEFAPEDDEESVNPNKPADWRHIFRGNIDDCFRIGIAFVGKTVRLYAPFYQCDIIIASPLGLRMIVGSEADRASDRDYDFLSSIEILVLDGASLLLMQNWEHVSIIMQCMNGIPSSVRDTDFSRVKEWYLDGRAKFHRQTIAFAHHLEPEIKALWNRQCWNLRRARIQEASIVGVLQAVVPKVRQLFQRIPVAKLADADDARFNFFVNQVIPQLTSSVHGQALVCIPSYFDFVRVRDYLTSEGNIDFAELHDYTELAEVSHQRGLFFRREVRLLLITERFHFFRRYHIRGVQSVVLYGPPQWAHFYAEWLNTLPEHDGTSVCLFTRYDRSRLQRILGSSKVKQLMSSEKRLHLVC